MSLPRSAISRPVRVQSSSCDPSWPRPRTGNRQPVADIGQIIFEIAIFVGLRLERHAADLAVARCKTPAGRAHAAPFGTINRHPIQNSERRREYLRPDPLAGVLHMAARAGVIELTTPRVEIAPAVLAVLERPRIVGDLALE